MATEYAYPVLGGMPEHVHNLSKEMVARGRTSPCSRACRPGCGGWRAGPTPRTSPCTATAPSASGSRCRSCPTGRSPASARHRRERRASPAPWRAWTSSTRGARRAHHLPVGDQGVAGAGQRRHLPRTSRAGIGLQVLLRVRAQHDRAHRPPHRGLRRVPDGAPALLPRPGVRRHPERGRHGLYRPLEPGEERPPGPPRILFVGRFDTRNRLDILLQAARILQDEGGTSSCRWSATARCVRCTTARPRASASGTGSGGWACSTGAPAPLPRGDGLRRALHPRLLRRGPARGDGLGPPIVCADNVGFRQVIRDARRAASSLPATPGPSRRHRRAARRRGSAPRLGRARPRRRGGALLVAEVAPRGRGSTSRSWRPRAAAPTIARRWGCASTCAATRSSSSATCRRRCGRAMPRSGSGD